MSVFNTSVTTVFLAPYLTAIAESAADADGRIHPLGISVPPGSFFGYVLSLSVLLQVLVLPLTGAIADRSGHKRQMLAAFATLGSLCTMAMFFVADERYLLGAALFIVANLCFGAATVVYYSWLPDLAGPDERDAVSSRGWAFGYLGGALLLAVSLALFTQYESLGLTEGEAVRICLASAGVWWAGFTVVSVTLLRNRRPREVVGDPRSGALSGGFRQLGSTLRDLRRYPLTLWFLGAYLLFNDGVQTIIGVSAQYGKEQLELSQTTLISAILLVQVVAFFGALALGRIAARIGAKRTVLGALVAWTGVLVAAYFLEAGAAVQFYALAVVIGFVHGRHPGAVPLAVQPADPPGPGGRVLRLLRDQRPRHQLARPVPVRADLPADRLLPVRHLQPGLLLRRRRLPPGEAEHAPGDHRGRQHPAGAPVTPLPRPTLPHPARPGRRPGLRGPAQAPGAGAPDVLPRADGLREVDPRAAGRPQPEPPGPARAAGDPGRPLGGPADQLAGRPLPRGGRDRRRHRPAAAGPQPLGRRPRVDYLIVDEAQFLTAGQVDQLAELVDESHVDVYAFGLTTDFRTRLFPGTQRLLEVADDIQRVQVEVLCWCGLPGLLNARVVDGAMVRSGETVVVADTAPAELPGDDALHSPAVRYQVLCRRHYVRGELGPVSAGPGQLALP